MISSKTFIGDSSTKVFPIDFEILGEDYVQIWLDNIAVTDRTHYDIINNSIVFLDDYIPASGVEIIIAVATTAQEIANLNAPPSGVVVVSDNIDNVNTVAGSIDNVNKTAGSIDSINIIAPHVTNIDYLAPSADSIDVVAGSIDNVNIVSANITNVDNVGEDIANVNIAAEAIKSGAGVTGQQFLGAGATKGIQYFSATSLPSENIVVVSGTNAFSVESFELADGATLTIEDGATYKVI